MNRFKETYTNVYNKLLKKKSTLYLNIILFTHLQRIKNKVMQQNLVKEYHDNPFRNQENNTKIKAKICMEKYETDVKKLYNDSCLRNK